MGDNVKTVEQFLETARLETGDVWMDNHDWRHLIEMVEQLAAELAAAQQRIAALEEALSVRVAIDDTNRTLAEDWKQMCRAARAAEKRGLGLDWWDDNGEQFGLLEANIMDRLTRLPEQTEDNNG